MNRRSFIKTGALFFPTIFVPRLIRAQPDVADTAEGIASFKKAVAGGSFPTGADGDWWFDNSLTDSSGNGNSMTVTGTTAYTTDEQGRANDAFSFNGSTFTALSLSSVGNYTTTAFSVLAWVKPTDISGSPVVVNHGAFSSSGWYLQLASDGHIEFQIGRGSAPTNAKVVTASSLVSTGNWYGILVIINGTAGKIYVAGTDRTSSSDVLSAPTSDSNNLRVGSYFNGSNKLTGAVAEVAIWGRVLNSTEISAIYSIGSQ